MTQRLIDKLMATEARFREAKGIRDRWAVAQSGAVLDYHANMLMYYPGLLGAVSAACNMLERPNIDDATFRRLMGDMVAMYREPVKGGE
jgi:hypothetical protein